MFASSLIAGGMQFAIAILLLGGWKAFVSHPSLIALIVVTLAMLCVAPFSNVNLNSGEKEDRANRWVFIAFSVIALASAVVPPYADRIGFLDDRRRNDALDRRRHLLLRRRASPVSSLHPRPPLQRTRRHPDRPQARNARHLQRHSQSQLSRHDCQHDRLGTRLPRRGPASPSHFSCSLPLVARIRSEERLLREHFGAEYEAYFSRTWRLLPGLY